MHTFSSNLTASKTETKNKLYKKHRRLKENKNLNTFSWLDKMAREVGDKQTDRQIDR